MMDTIPVQDLHAHPELGFTDQSGTDADATGV